LPVTVGVIRAGFACALLGVLVLSLWPLEKPVPVNTGWDKTDHLLAYLVLGLLGLGSWTLPAAARGLIPVGRERLILLLLLAFGAMIEGLQGMTETRHADWQDLLANGIGLVLAWFTFALRSARGSRRRP
jgi:VanZ family protein